MNIEHGTKLVVGRIRAQGAGIRAHEGEHGAWGMEQGVKDCHVPQGRDSQ